MINSYVYKQPSGEPWLDKALSNFARDEISYVLDPIPQASYMPQEIFSWLCKNRVEKHLFNALANLVPLFPLVSYYGEVSSWYAPPPSGAGNAVVIVMGNHNKKFRLIGGNFFNEFPNHYKRIIEGDFWETLATKTSDLDKTRHISLYLQEHMSDSDCNYAEQVTRESNLANTMPVYLMVIDEDSKKNHFWAMPAIVHGHHPSDMKHEKMWEVV